MLKNAAIVCAVLSVVIAISGLVFISKYDISGSSTSMIEASLMQVAHLRYIAASIFALAATVLYSAHQVIGVIQSSKSHAS